MAAAFGAYREQIEDPDALDAAIVRCLAAVDNARAVLHVDITPL